MASVSMAEQVLRELGPLQMHVRKLYEAAGMVHGQTYQDTLKILVRLEAMAERRVDLSTAEHYRRQRAEARDLGANLPEPRRG